MNIDCSLRSRLCNLSHLAHLFDGWIRLHNIIIRHLIFIVDAAAIASPRNFPQYQTEGVHIGTLERIEMVDVERFVEYFGCHVTLCAHTMVGRYVDGIIFDIMSYGQTEIAYRTAHIRFDQNVFGFQVAVGNCRFSCNSNIFIYIHENWLYDVATFGVDCIRTQQFKKAREITQRK